ncbi:MAG: hypothetical protein DHS20C17_35120 [Cyclobacteriaceae bacterium]|nr:MAG: hypothetical protein DHS20C17_35120 [Cyclobacteriaceae bacterium]
MNVSAKIKNSRNDHQVTVSSGSKSQQLTMASAISGYGSAVSGGELLMLALATCYCNDIYREAEKRKIKITQVTVEATGAFLDEGQAAQDISYTAWLEGDVSKDEIKVLKRHTNNVAEIQNTLRAGVEVKFGCKKS